MEYGGQVREFPLWSEGWRASLTSSVLCLRFIAFLFLFIITIAIPLAGLLECLFIQYNYSH